MGDVEALDPDRGRCEIQSVLEIGDRAGTVHVAGYFRRIDLPHRHALLEMFQGLEMVPEDRRAFIISLSRGLSHFFFPLLQNRFVTPPEKQFNFAPNAAPLFHLSAGTP